MERAGRYDGMLDYIQAHWPAYLLGYGGGALLILGATWLGLARDWYSLFPLAAAAVLIITYFFLMSLWAAHRLYDNPAIRDTLFRLGDLSPGSTVVQLNLGRRRLPVSFSQRLISGGITVVDIYNPQLTPSRALARQRRRAPHADPDPRLTWIDGAITLLPLPDDSVQVVVMVETISEFWQFGDRKLLLLEVYRILAPGGRLLVAERMRTRTNWLVLGPGALRLANFPYWKRLLEQAGLLVRQQEELYDLICCLRADKPRARQDRQLIFDFDGGQI